MAPDFREKDETQLLLFNSLQREGKTYKTHEKGLHELHVFFKTCCRIFETNDVLN